MKKIAINRCFGGFGFSNKAYKRYAELLGKKAYFFNHENGGKFDMDKYYPCSDGEENNLFVNVFTIPNPNEYLKKDKGWRDMTTEEREEVSNRYKSVSLYSGDFKRDDPIVIKVIEELGNEASGRCAELGIVEIPDDIEWEIDEYDGLEKVEEKHKSWS